MKNGLGKHSRTEAKNYSYKEAQARLDDTLNAFDKQTENALFVNATKIEYYHICRTGIPCTCGSVPTAESFSNIPETNTAPLIPPPSGAEEVGNGQGVKITMRKNTIFGEGEAERNDDHAFDVLSADQGFEQNELVSLLAGDDDTGEIGFSESHLYGNNIDCGICYRTGISPGYTSNRRQRTVLTSHEVIKQDSYYINSTQAPCTIEKQHKDGYVEYKVNVPKYFSEVLYSIRNNNISLPMALLLYNNVPMSLSILKQNAGKTITVRVTELVFTHVIIDFTINKEPLVANLSGDTLSLDYSKMETLSNFQVVIPNNVWSVNSGDVIVAPERRLTLKIVDISRKRTATGRVFGWELGTRVLQPSETLNNISQMRRLL